MGTKHLAWLSSWYANKQSMPHKRGLEWILPFKRETRKTTTTSREQWVMFVLLAHHVCLAQWCCWSGETGRVCLMNWLLIIHLSNILALGLLYLFDSRNAWSSRHRTNKENGGLLLVCPLVWVFKWAQCTEVEERYWFKISQSSEKIGTQTCSAVLVGCSVCWRFWALCTGHTSRCTSTNSKLQ